MTQVTREQDVTNGMIAKCREKRLRAEWDNCDYRMKHLPGKVEGFLMRYLSGPAPSYDTFLQCTANISLYVKGNHRIIRLGTPKNMQPCLLCSTAPARAMTSMLSPFTYTLLAPLKASCRSSRPWPTQSLKHTPLPKAWQSYLDQGRTALPNLCA